MAYIENGKNIFQVESALQPDFDKNSFVEGVFNGEYILVIGSGVILNRNISEFKKSEGDINEYIIEKINDEGRRNSPNTFMEYKSFNDIFCDLSDNLSDPICSLLNNKINYDISDISPELKNIIELRLFRIVLTTTVDGYLETLMREIWGDDLRIVNIVDIQSLGDFATALRNSRKNKYNQPTLFYIFGKVRNDQSKDLGYVRTDVDAIRIIEQWMVKTDEKWIVPFLQEKRMLAIGCKFDDWYFRFFWYIITRGFYDEDRKGRKNFNKKLKLRDNLVISFNPNDISDKQLKDYLMRRKVCLHEGNVWSFMESIYNLLSLNSNEKTIRDLVLANRKKGQIFISYKGCNRQIARELFFRLTNLGLNVWYDDVCLVGGDDYNEEIMAAIENAKIFLPIISPEVAYDLQIYNDNTPKENYIKEWKLAKNNKYLTVIPIAVNGYQWFENKDIHSLFEQIVNRKNVTIDYTPKYQYLKSNVNNGFAGLIQALEKQLNIKIDEYN